MPLVARIRKHRRREGQRLLDRIGQRPHHLDIRHDQEFAHLLDCDLAASVRHGFGREPARNDGGLALDRVRDTELPDHAGEMQPAGAGAGVAQRRHAQQQCAHAVDGRNVGMRSAGPHRDADGRNGNIAPGLTVEDCLGNERVDARSRQDGDVPARTVRDVLQQKCRRLVIDLRRRTGISGHEFAENTLDGKRARDAQARHRCALLTCCRGGCGPRPRCAADRPPPAPSMPVVQPGRPTPACDRCRWPFRRPRAWPASARAGRDRARDAAHRGCRLPSRRRS